MRDGEAITVMSTSPTKSESGFASPNLAPSRPRGHAHRRSAAISSHDLSMILQPSDQAPLPRGSSAPSSPADFDRRQDYSFPSPREEPARANSQPSPKIGTTLPDAIPSPTESDEESKPPVKHASRARVGFSDTLEFIPRPLSLVSNETSSTVTVRPGHSLSGSISSIISLSGSTHADREPSVPLSRSPSKSGTDSRPSTAGAVLERSQSNATEGGPVGGPRRRNSIPVLVQVPAADVEDAGAPSPTKTPKRWSFFGLDPFIGTASPTRSRPVSSSSGEVAMKASCPSPLTANQPATATAEVASETLQPKPVNRKASKKKKRVKTWAGSILTRKGKPRRKSRRAPTPPPTDTWNNRPQDVADVSDGELMDPDLMLIGESQGPVTTGGPWRRRPVDMSDEDSSLPMIDLDAALGPFNTPLGRNPEWEAAQRAGGFSKRQLHSAAGMTRFTGPGMHYSHRRAESAPEMPPFNRAGLPRFSSNSTMADVFEEDEEEDDEEMGDDDSEAATTPGAEEPSPIDIRVSVAGDSRQTPSQDTMEDVASFTLSRRGSGISRFSDDDKTQPSLGPRSDYSASSLHEDVIMEEHDSGLALPIMIGARSDHDSSSSTTPSPRFNPRCKDPNSAEISPLQLPTTASLAPISPYSTQSSAFPSPRTPMSFDANRMSTAPSSVTEDHFQSLLMGEPGPDVRNSSDMPSLTSSNSTMTRESINPAQTPQHRPQLPFRGERPASFTSTQFGRRRSSLASLQRLINTSHGERSKLSMEVTLDPEATEKKPKVSKAKRISRMMQFWRPSKD